MDGSHCTKVPPDAETIADKVEFAASFVDIMSDIEDAVGRSENGERSDPVEQTDTVERAVTPPPISIEPTTPSSVSANGEYPKEPLVRETSGDSSDNDTVGNTTFETTYETGDSGSDYDSTDEEEEDSEPPKLKYSRLAGLPSNFFTRDPVSCCNFHENYFIFATHSGIVHITKPDFTTIRTFKAHRASVLSIYTDGQFFATGSMDGVVVIGSLKDEKDIIAYDFKRPIHAVVLDSNYNKTRSFVSGGMSGKVIHSSKNWLGQRSDFVLDEDNGPIVSIQVVDDILIWMNDKGITLYHILARQVIKVIEKPEDSPRSDLYWPRVHFLETDRILVGWANYIWALRVSIRSADDKSEVASNKSRILPSTATISFRAVQEKKVEVDHVFKLDALIAGISSFKDDYWMILSYEPPTPGSTTPNFPDLKLINSLTGEVDFEEEIGLRNNLNLGLNDYSLHRHLGLDGTKYFIVSAKDTVIAQEFTLNDRLTWFLEKDRYKEAWDISEHLRTPLERLNIGINYVDNLMKTENWQEAALFLKTLLYLDENKLPEEDTKSTILTSKSNKSSQSDSYDDEYVKNVIQQWEGWSNIFIKSGNIKLLNDIIPTSSKLALSTSIYDEILSYWISVDIFRAVELIKLWDTDLYDVGKIEGLLESASENDDSAELKRSLVELYVKTSEPQKAVSHLMKLRDPHLIEFLAKNHLLTNFIDDLPFIIKMRFTEDEFGTTPLSELKEKLSTTIDILVEGRHEISPTRLVKLMEDNNLEFINYLYIEAIKEKDDYLLADFGNKRIKLYSEFNRGKLLPFLMRSNNYDIDYAISVCEQSEFIEELVYLLGKVGENKKALMLIIDKLDDPEVAINFAKHQNDQESWDILLDYSMTKPAFIKALIECADDQSNLYYDPVSIIQRIPSNVKIEGLKSSLTKISENYELNFLLNQLILKIIYRRSEEVSTDYRQRLLKGLEIDTADSNIKELVREFDTLLLFKDEVSEPTLELQRVKIGKGSTKTSFSDLEEKINYLKLLNELGAK